MQATTFSIGRVRALGRARPVRADQPGASRLLSASAPMRSVLGTADYHLSYWFCLLAGIVIALVAGAISRHVDRCRLGGHYLAIGDDLVPADRHAGHDQRDLAQPRARRRLQYRPSGTVSGPRKAISPSASRALAIVGYLVWHLPDTKIGRAMRAVRDNELAAGASTASTCSAPRSTRSRSAQASAGSRADCSRAALAYVSPDQFSFAESIVFLTMSLLGGVASPIGSAIGTGLLILIPEWLRFLKSIPGLYLAIYGLFVILIIRFMPDGIWGFVAGRIFERWRAHSRRRRAAKNLLLKPATVGGDIVLEGLRSLQAFRRPESRRWRRYRGPRGGVHALIGPNGSGKTTTLQCASPASTRRRRARSCSTAPTSPNMPPHQRTAAGTGPDIPEHPPVPFDDGAGKCRDRRRTAR